MGHTPKGSGRSQRFNLTLYYSVTSFAFIALATVVVSYLSAKHATESLIAQRESLAVTFGQHLDRMILDEFTHHIEQENTVVDLKNPNHMRRLNELIVRNIQSPDIVSVVLYDLDGIIVYATDSSLIGLDAGGGKDWQKAIAGEIVSEVERPADHVEPGHARLKSIQVATYMPTRFIPKSGDEEGPIIGVVEFYQDASDLATLIASARRRAILSTLSSFGLLFVLLLLVVRRGDATIRVRTRELEGEIARRQRAQEEILAHQEGLRHMTLELSLVEERERRRLATYLHDEIGQALVLLRMKFGQLSQDLDLAEHHEKVDDLRSMLEQAIDDTQSLTFDLSPPVLSELGLEAALEQAAEKIGKENGIGVAFRDEGPGMPTDPGVRDFLFRAVRELMLNVVKHARASTMAVIVRGDNGGIRISVEDDGIGFDPSSIETRTWQGGGFGLPSIRERLAHIKGTLDIESKPGAGTRIALSAPLLLTDVPARGGAP